MLTTKSLIFISLILAFAFADAFIDGDAVAFKTHGSFFNANYQYLDSDAGSSSVGMAADLDRDTTSGTWWYARELPDGNWAFENFPSSYSPNSPKYLNGNTYTGGIDLASGTETSGAHWALEELSDGNVALRCLGSFSNPNHVYLNVDTYTGHVNLAAGTGASGTHWEVILLQLVEDQECPPSWCPP